MNKDRLLPDPITRWKALIHDGISGWETTGITFNKFVDFIQQPLALWMFIPCKDGKPLEKPNKNRDVPDFEHSDEYWYFLNKEYQKAEARTFVVGNWVIEEDDMMDGIWIRNIDNGQVLNIKDSNLNSLCNKIEIKEEKWNSLNL